LFVKKEFSLADLSGLMTVGIGDSFASLVGSKFGRLKYPFSKKSFEGTLALVFSQLVVYYVLSGCFGVFQLFEWLNFLFVAISLLASAFIEAFCVDNDNLVLPIVVYPFLYLVR
jgi:dolichol kinase